jgi:hypothetical protein
VRQRGGQERAGLVAMPGCERGDLHAASVALC